MQNALAALTVCGNPMAWWFKELSKEHVSFMFEPTLDRAAKAVQQHSKGACVSYVGESVCAYVCACVYLCRSDVISTAPNCPWSCKNLLIVKRCAPCFAAKRRCLCVTHVFLFAGVLFWLYVRGNQDFVPVHCWTHGQTLRLSCRRSELRLDLAWAMGWPP